MHKVRATLVGVIVALIVGVLGVGAAAADTNTDDVQQVLNGCTIHSWGTNLSNGQAKATVEKLNNCGQQVEIFLAYVNGGGSVVWGGSAILGASEWGIGHIASISSGAAGNFFGRRIRVGGLCWQDTIFSNLAPVGC